MLEFRSTYFELKCSLRRKEEIRMKQGIHPDYHRIKCICSSCGAEFETGSTIKGNELRVDTCSNCHPFFTGRQRFAAAQGRIEKFNRKYGLKNGK